MKTIIIKKYINGLASFLDEERIKWERTNKPDEIIIYVNSEEDLFRIGMRFEKFLTETNPPSTNPLAEKN